MKNLIYRPCGCPFLALLIVTTSCNSHLSTEKKERIWQQMRTNSMHRIIGAIEEIRKSKDTSMLNALLYKSSDPRVTNMLAYKGKSIYQLKMEAVESITGVAAPKPITFEVDTSTIQYYLRIFNLQDSSRIK